MEIGRKVHPSLPIFLHQYREAISAGSALGTNPPPELVEEIGLRCRAQLTQALSEYPTIPFSLIDLVYALEPCSEQQGFFQFLHFHRHGRPLKPDLRLAGSGELDAWERLIRTEHDFGMLFCGAGPVKPSKAASTHADIFLFGIGLGLEMLTKEELADFFDNHCCCGEAHDGDALKKQYTRMVRNFVLCFQRATPNISRSGPKNA